jgi:hypothetical protein
VVMFFLREEWAREMKRCQAQQENIFRHVFPFTAQTPQLPTDAYRFKYSIGQAKQSVQLVLDLAKAPRELGQRRRKFVVQFRDLELGGILLDADACPQAPKSLIRPCI